MDVADTVPRKQLDAATQTLKKRELDQARELEQLREKQKDQIAALESTQKRVLDQTRARSEQALADSRQRFESSLDKNRDQFEKTIQNERLENYNRLGKIQNEAALERSRKDEIQRGQLEDLVGGGKKTIDSERQMREQRFSDLRQQYEQDKKQLESDFERKMSAQQEANARALTRNAQDNRRQKDEFIRRTTRDVETEKLSNNVKYEKLADESKSDRESLRASFGLREQQLKDEKEKMIQDRATRGEASLEEFKRRNAQSIDETLNHYNFLQNKKDRDNQDKLARAEHSHRMKEQEMRHDFGKATQNLKHEKQLEKDRADLRQGLREKQMMQDQYLSNEGVRRNAQNSVDSLKQTYSDELRKQKDQSESNAQELTRTFQNRMRSDELKNTEEFGRIKLQHSLETNAARERADNEKRRIAMASQVAVQSSEEQADDHTSRLREEFENQTRQIRRESQQKVYNTSREARQKVSQMEQTLANREAEFEALKKMEQDSNDLMARSRTKRLTELYSKNLLATKENYDEASEEFKSYNASQSQRLRSDADHEKRMLMYDLQSRNRSMAIQYEAKLAESKDRYEAEMTKLKAEQEKEIRETLKRTKEQIEFERSQHAKELESKERTMKEKLKLQEEAFKDQIDKLRRTNELILARKS